MQRFLSWFKKYFIVFVALALVVSAAVMTVDLTGLTSVKEVAGEGKDTNHTVSTREEFDALLSNSVAPLAARYAQNEIMGTSASPTFQSLTMHVAREWRDSHGRNMTSYTLALTAEAVYLKFDVEEVESFYGETEDWGWQQEFYIKGDEVYARISQCYYIRNGVEMTEMDFKQRGADDIEGIPLEMAYGELFGKWVCVNGTRMEKTAKYEISYAYTLAKTINAQGVFTGGKEPLVVLEETVIAYDGRSYDVDDYAYDDSTTVVYTLQYKYINNTVIEDIGDKKAENLKDYLQKDD